MDKEKKPDQQEESVVPVPAEGSFKKIEMHDTPSVVITKKRHIPRGVKGLLFALPLVLLVFIIAIGVPAFGVYKNMKDATSAGRVLGAALKNQNLKETKASIPPVTEKLTNVKNSLKPLVWLRIIPLIGGYYSDVNHIVDAGIHGVEALSIAIDSVEPYADLLGLEGESKFVAGSAEERIQTAVQTLDKVTPNLAKIGEKVELLNKDIDAINPNRYPKNIGKTIVRDRIVQAKEVLKTSTDLFINARPFLEELPRLLGEPEPKRYFVLFQNDKELRPTGGFLTAYAIFKMEHGKPVVELSEDIYVLDEQHGKAPPAPEEIRTYHKGVYKFNLRDSNLSPDFAVSMQQFKDLYKGDFDFDGVIAVDTHVLVEALKILGDFNISGRNFSAELDDRCDCPKVVYELEDYSTRPVAYVRDARKDILGALLLQIMQRALGVSPSQYWGQLSQMAISEINQKHILAYMQDEKSQKAIESLNMGGRIANGVELMGYTDSVGWDYLHINNANMAGAKSNLFVTEEMTIDYAVEKDAVIKTVTVDYKNPAEGSDCNLESGGLCLNGLLRNWVRVYVPKGSELISSSGSQSPQDDQAVDMKVKEDLGKTVFEGFLTVRPLGSAQLVVKYKIPIKPGKDFKTFIQKQPGTDGQIYKILVNGKQKDEFTLEADRVVEVRL